MRGAAMTKNEAAADALKKAEAERQRLLAIENEKVDVRSKIALSLNEYFEDHLQMSINLLTDLFNNSNLSNFKENSLAIKAFPVTYSNTQFPSPSFHFSF